jgi:hypothetical protein
MYQLYVGHTSLPTYRWLHRDTISTPAPANNDSSLVFQKGYTIWELSPGVKQMRQYYFPPSAFSVNGSLLLPAPRIGWRSAQRLFDCFLFGFDLEMLEVQKAMQLFHLLPCAGLSLSCSADQALRALERCGLLRHFGSSKKPIGTAEAAVLQGEQGAVRTFPQQDHPCGTRPSWRANIASRAYRWWSYRWLLLDGRAACAR